MGLGSYILMSLTLAVSSGVLLALVYGLSYLLQIPALGSALGQAGIVIADNAIRTAAALPAIFAISVFAFPAFNLMLIATGGLTIKGVVKRVGAKGSTGRSQAQKDETGHRKVSRGAARESGRFGDLYNPDNSDGLNNLDLSRPPATPKPAARAVAAVSGLSLDWDEPPSARLEASPPAESPLSGVGRSLLDWDEPISAAPEDDIVPRGASRESGRFGDLYNLDNSDGLSNLDLSRPPATPKPAARAVAAVSGLSLDWDEPPSARLEASPPAEPPLSGVGRPLLDWDEPISAAPEDDTAPLDDYGYQSYDDYDDYDPKALYTEAEPAAPPEPEAPGVYDGFQADMPDESFGGDWTDALSGGAEDLSEDFSADRYREDPASGLTDSLVAEPAAIPPLGGMDWDNMSDSDADKYWDELTRDMSEDELTALIAELEGSLGGGSQ
ncbi:MAG: hypothetical protein LBK41_07155 [Clostridiales bacterium]|nr:hypothetical protein [Clostridiales bacterium]